jgi:single-stranded-DNA-specific exonuclease
MELAALLEQQVWGQGFPQPAFEDSFTVAQQRIVGEKHLKLRLVKDNRDIDAMLFFHHEQLPPNIRAVYRLNVNEYKGSRTLQLTLEHWEAA